MSSLSERVPWLGKVTQNNFNVRFGCSFSFSLLRLNRDFLRKDIVHALLNLF